MASNSLADWCHGNRQGHDGLLRSEFGLGRGAGGKQERVNVRKARIA